MMKKVIKQTDIAIYWLEKYKSLLLNLSLTRGTLYNDGFNDGVQTGEKRLKQLMCLLEQDDRKEDIFRAMKDPEFLKKLYEEYELV